MRINTRTAAIGSAALVVLAAVGALLFWPKPSPPLALRVANAGQLSVLNVIAERNGYFDKHGLDVTMTEYESGAATVAAMLAGDADVSVAADFVGARTVFARDDLRIIASLATRHSNVYQVVARRGSGIEAPQDLKGKRLGVSHGTVGEFYLGRFLLINGLDMDDIILKDLPPAEQVEQMSDGRIDAIVSFEPTAHAVARTLGDEAVSWSAQGGLTAYGLSYTTAAFAESSPEALRRYLQALREAERFTVTRNAEAKEMVAASLALDDAYMDSVWRNLMPGVRLDQELVLTLETQGRWLIDSGLTDETTLPNYLSHIHFPAIEAAAPEVVTLIH
jgi:NitT/TauT family transport system substrate-binding protein